jgi:hypothetical protein
MKRTAVLVLATALLLNACIPLPFLGQPTVTPAVDAQATDAALAATLAADTLSALPTPTSEPASDTPEPTVTETVSSTATKTATESVTPDPNSTATQTGTAVTGTVGTTTVTITGTISPTTQVNATATETLYPRFFGTLPPAVPFGKIHLANKAKADVYVSLQCTTVDGYKTIIEYPVFGRLNVSAPAGKYVYVAWIGGRQFKGSFSLSKGEELSITFNKDKVTLK